MNASTFLNDPALGVALAMAVGMCAQAIAQHVKIPGIVLLLAAGVLLGPDLLGWIQPAALDGTLQTLVGFAVAVILFEGGMNLNLERLRREAVSIRQLVTIGAVVTAAGGAVAARFILDWDWTRSILFGTLVIVTGPTVINPLLRRIKVRRNVATVLEAEGVLVDAVGAIIAVVALEVALSPSSESLALGGWHLVRLLGFGTLAGLALGLLLAFLLRFEDLVPEGLENVFTLSLVLAVFQASNALQHESGIVTVTVAGLVMGNAKTHVLDDLKEFKEQLTVLLIGMLFVLLAADVRLDEVRALGWRGALTVLALIFLVRPLNVLVGTRGSDLKWNEKAFLAWLAPRGIVAAAVSSLFAQELEAKGIDGGSELRALVFLVIATTVLLQGLTGGWVAKLLGVRDEGNKGYLILGANPFALALGELARDAGQEVAFLDSNPDACRDAEERGLRVLFGSGLAETLLVRAGLDSRAGCLALTGNDEVNLAFIHKAKHAFKVPLAWVALRQGHVTVSPGMIERDGGRVLFGGPRNLGMWAVRLTRGQASVESWSWPSDEPPTAEAVAAGDDALLLPLAVRRQEKFHWFDGATRFRKDDELLLMVFETRRAEAAAWLQEMGWRRTAAAPGGAVDGAVDGETTAPGGLEGAEPSPG